MHNAWDGGVKRDRRPTGTRPPDGVHWYRQVLELSEPDLEPAEGIVEFQVGPPWLQLSEGSTTRSGAVPVLRLGVADAAAQRRRLEAMGVAVGPLEHVPGAVDYFDFTDPDGNALSMYSELD
jgi:predicted enzyme related to lactoylglutathione lyase